MTVAHLIRQHEIITETENDFLYGSVSGRLSKDVNDTLNTSRVIPTVGNPGRSFRVNSNEYLLPY